MVIIISNDNSPPPFTKVLLSQGLCLHDTLLSSERQLKPLGLLLSTNMIIIYPGEARSIFYFISYLQMFHLPKVEVYLLLFCTYNLLSISLVVSWVESDQKSWVGQNSTCQPENTNRSSKQWLQLTVFSYCLNHGYDDGSSWWSGQQKHTPWYSLSP